MRRPASAGLATRSAWTRCTEASGRGGASAAVALVGAAVVTVVAVVAPVHPAARVGVEDLGVVVGLVVVADARADDVGLTSLGHLLGDALPRALEPRRACPRARRAW